MRINGNQGITDPATWPHSVLPDRITLTVTAGRNSVRFDPYYNSDIGLHKNFPLYPEGVSFDFRAEAFNIFNQTNYGFPQSGYSPTSTSFGVVTASTTARRVSCSSPERSSFSHNPRRLIS